jgi:hypothetical protein
MWQIATEGQDPQAHRFQIERNLSNPPITTPPTSKWFGDKPTPVTGDRPLSGQPRYRDAEMLDFRLMGGSPGVGLGAFEREVRLTPGLAMSGHVLTTFNAKDRFEPITIPRRLFNGRVHDRGRVGGWFSWRSMWTHDLRLLPAGQQMLGDVLWEVEDYTKTPDPTLFILKGQGSYTDEAEIRGIPVGTKAGRLHFLHTHNPSDETKEGATVFRYIVNYQDGRRVEVPVRWGQEIGHWRRQDVLNHLPHARVAHYDAIRFLNGDRRQPVPNAPQLVVYRFAWTNPRRNASIASIDIVSANTEKADLGAPAIFAITAEAAPARSK